MLAILDRLICEFAREERARFIIFKEFNADGARDLKGLESLGYRQADSYPMNYAVSDYRDFDDYLARIRSKKRRMLRGSLRKFAKGNFRVVTLTGREGAADHYTDRVHRLYEAVLSRSPVQFEYLPAEFLRELARRLPDNTSFTYVYRGDEVVAYAASVFSETTFHGVVLGIDYDLNREYELYFNVLFKALDVAFRRGVAGNPAGPDGGHDQTRQARYLPGANGDLRQRGQEHDPYRLEAGLPALLSPATGGLPSRCGRRDGRRG